MSGGSVPGRTPGDPSGAAVLGTRLDFNTDFSVAGLTGICRLAETYSATVNSMPMLVPKGVNLVLSQLEVSEGGLRVFFNICKEWGLTQEEEQVLLGESGSIVTAWKAGTVQAPLDPATLERLSYIFRIYGALEILLPVPVRAAVWIKEPNTAPPFDGKTALDRMLKGNTGDLRVVADYLEVTLNDGP